MSSRTTGLPRWCVEGTSAVALCLAASLCAAEKPGSAPLTPANQKEAGKLVAQAIEAEAQADLTGREKLLGEALRIAPDYPPARWQSGQFRVGSDWLTMDGATQQASKADILDD